MQKNLLKIQDLSLHFGKSLSILEQDLLNSNDLGCENKWRVVWGKEIMGLLYDSCEELSRDKQIKDEYFEIDIKFSELFCILRDYFRSYIKILDAIKQREVIINGIIADILNIICEIEVLMCNFNKIKD